MLRSLSAPVKLLLLVAIVAAVWALMPSSTDTPVRKSARPVASRVSKKGDVTYLDVDYNPPKFAPPAATLKNVFKPIVAKTVTSKGASAVVNIVPTSFAGGEANWVYTGTAEMDGVLQALLENRVTGEGVFLKVGDSWKGISVEEITDDSIVLATADGLEKKLTLPVDDTVVAGTTPGATGVAPVQPGNGGLRGSIGPIGLQPDPNAQNNFTGVDNNMNGLNPADLNSGNGRRRGGRRNGGGNFGG